jgi:hypothetical protein
MAELADAADSKSIPALFYFPQKSAKTRARYDFAAIPHFGVYTCFRRFGARGNRTIGVQEVTPQSDVTK